MNFFKLITIFVFALSISVRANTLVWPLNTQTDVVSAVPFYAGEGVTRYQQWLAGRAFGTNTTNVHLTSIAWTLQGTNTLQFTNFVLTLSATTNQPSKLLASNLNSSASVIYSNPAYALALGASNWNFGFTVSNAFAFNATNQNLLIDIQMGQTNGSAAVALASAGASAGSLSNAFRLFSTGATNALFIDSECIPTQLQWTNP